MLAPIGRAASPGSGFAVCFLLEQVNSETPWQCQMIGCDGLHRRLSSSQVILPIQASTR